MPVFALKTMGLYCQVIMKISANRSQLLFLSIVVQQWAKRCTMPQQWCLEGKTVTWEGSYTNHFHLEDRCNPNRDGRRKESKFLHFHLFSAVLEWFLSNKVLKSHFQ